MARPIADFNPQDEVSLLAEDLRLGWLGRPVAPPTGTGEITRFENYQSGISIDGVATFLLPTFPSLREDVCRAAQGALLQIQDGTFRLPFPRCLFLLHIASGHRALLLAPLLKPNHPLHNADHNYALLCEELTEDDGETITGIEVTGFMHHPIMHDHWSKQHLDALINLGSREIELNVDYEFCRGYAKGTRDRQRCEALLNASQASFEYRLEWSLAMTHAMQSRPQGAGVHAEPGTAAVSGRVAERRARLGLPSVPPVRVIDLTEPAQATVNAATVAGHAGRVVEPHYRRGNWATSRKTGKRWWRRSSAIHGGGDGPPPWYEFRV